MEGGDGGVLTLPADAPVAQNADAPADAVAEPQVPVPNGVAPVALALPLVHGALQVAVGEDLERDPLRDGRAVDAGRGGDGDGGRGEDGVGGEVVDAGRGELDELEGVGEGGEEARGGEIRHRA